MLYKFFKVFLYFTLYTFLIFIFLKLPYFNSEKVLFYKGIKVLFLVDLILIIVFLFLKEKLSFVFIVTSIFFLIHLLILFTFPVTYDRSLTIFILKKLNEGPKAENQLENLLIDKYIKKDKALIKRIDEQKKINTIDLRNGKIILTEKGKIILKINEFIYNFYK